MCPSENSHAKNSNTKHFRRSSMDDDASKVDGPSLPVVLPYTSTHPTLLMPPQFLTYSQSSTLLQILTQHQHPPCFILPARYYDPGDHICEAFSCGASFTKYIEASNQIWSCCCACIFDHFIVWQYHPAYVRETLIP